MVEDRVTDGRRIAELLSSELHGREDGGLAAVAVVDAAESVEPTADGALAYRVEADGDSLASAYVHPNRVHLAFEAGREGAARAGADAGLRVRPKATRPPETLVFVESGAEVKRAAEVVATVAARRRSKGD
jgi:hypothetical protein